MVLHVGIHALWYDVSCCFHVPLKAIEFLHNVFSRHELAPPRKRSMSMYCLVEVRKASFRRI